MKKSKNLAVVTSDIEEDEDLLDDKDGKVDDAGDSATSCHGKGVLEVKCPYSLRDLSLSDMVQHQCCLTPDGLLRKSHPYYMQLQVQMYVFQVQYGILLLFTQTLAVCSIERDEFLQSCLGQLHSFWYTHMLSENLPDVHAPLPVGPPAHG